MKYFLDTEFIEDGRTIDLISVAVVAEDGRELYVENSEVDLSRANPWVNDNVVPHLWSRQPDKRPFNEWIRDGGRGGLFRRRWIGTELRIFTAGDEAPEFWGYYADYDWVVLCQLFGTMIDLPEGWPMFCMDIKQLCASLGDPPLPEQGEGEHHALADARWNKVAYDFLMGSTFPAPGELDD